jgi:hypothetical protein
LRSCDSFKFEKRTKFFVGTDDKSLSVAAVHDDPDVAERHASLSFVAVLVKEAFTSTHKTILLRNDSHLPNSSYKAQM